MENRVTNETSDQFLPVKTSEEVIERIAQITAQAERDQDRVGYFAALYHHVAVKIVEELERGAFDDAVALERVDVVFFNRYLDALNAYRSKRGCSACWQIAFETAKDPDPIVLQHLLLGMNAHINFDLGIAVADAIPKGQLPAFKADFERMNDLLASLLQVVMRDLAMIWPALKPIDLLLGDLDTAVINFSMRKAREYAWEFANALQVATPSQRATELSDTDDFVAELGQTIADPGCLINIPLHIVRLGEIGDPADIIKTLLKS